MRKPINGSVLDLLLIDCLVGMGYPLVQACTLSTVQAKLSALSASSALEAPDTESFLSHAPASRGGSVELARLNAAIPPHLLVRRINQERGFNPTDVSSAGTEGIAAYHGFTCNLHVAITACGAEWLSCELVETHDSNHNMLGS
jgi:hypothetical protein